MNNSDNARYSQRFCCCPIQLGYSCHHEQQWWCKVFLKVLLLSYPTWVHVYMNNSDNARYSQRFCCCPIQLGYTCHHEQQWWCKVFLKCLLLSYPTWVLMPPWTTVMMQGILEGSVAFLSNLGTHVIMNNSDNARYSQRFCCCPIQLGYSCHHEQQWWCKVFLKVLLLSYPTWVHVYMNNSDNARYSWRFCCCPIQLGYSCHHEQQWWCKVFLKVLLLSYPTWVHVYMNNSDNARYSWRFCCCPIQLGCMSTWTTVIMQGILKGSVAVLSNLGTRHHEQQWWCTVFLKGRLLSYPTWVLMPPWTTVMMHGILEVSVAVLSNFGTHTTMNNSDDARYSWRFCCCPIQLGFSCHHEQQWWCAVFLKVLLLSYLTLVHIPPWTTVMMQGILEGSVAVLSNLGAHATMNNSDDARYSWRFCCCPIQLGYSCHHEQQWWCAVFLKVLLLSYLTLVHIPPWTTVMMQGILWGAVAVLSNLGACLHEQQWWCAVFLKVLLLSYLTLVHMPPWTAVMMQGILEVSVAVLSNLGTHATMNNSDDARYSWRVGCCPIQLGCTCHHEQQWWCKVFLKVLLLSYPTWVLMPPWTTVMMHGILEGSVAVLSNLGTHATMDNSDDARYSWRFCCCPIQLGYSCHHGQQWWCKVFLKVLLLSYPTWVLMPPWTTVMMQGILEGSVAVLSNLGTHATMNNSDDARYSWRFCCWPIQLGYSCHHEQQWWCKVFLKVLLLSYPTWVYMSPWTTVMMQGILEGSVAVLSNLGACLHEQQW